MAENEIELCKKQRAQIRRLFSKSCSALETESKKDSPDAVAVAALIGQIEEKGEQLKVLDGKIAGYLLSSTGNEYEEECTLADSYRDKLFRSRALCQSMVDREARPRVESLNNPLDESLSETRKKYRLPKIELRHFDGDLRKWIGFWGLFRQIHEDPTIPGEDKFQYLLQSTVPGSKARELIESFPPSAANYELAIEQLKGRFARDELLIEVYVRELLALVLKQVTSGPGLPLDTLFDRMETHLRALGTLGVTRQKYAAMLYPLVESALPEETIKLWERHKASRGCDGNSREGQDGLDDLSALMEFLKLEVEGQQRVSLARDGFSLPKEEKTRSKKRDDTNIKSPATAATLFASETGETVGKKSHCIFCDKSGHPSQECHSAQKLVLEERQEAVRKKRACLRCLRTGHLAKKCRAWVKCIICSKDHFPLLCPQLVNLQSNSDKGEKTETLFQAEGAQQVLLQTLIVRVRCGKKNKLVRVLLDSGAQRSYALRDSLKELNVPKLGEETMVHSLFGGQQSKKITHGRYELELQSIKGDFKCKVAVLDQDCICQAVPRLQDALVLSELTKQGIALSDTGEGTPTVELLLGADMLTGLLTGGIREVTPAALAVHTKLGWTIMGVCNSSSTNHVLTSLTLKNVSIAELWELESLGIRDPIEAKTRHNHDQEVLKRFSESVVLNEEHRYQVKLPWVEGHPPLPTNLELAERRLHHTSRRLSAGGKLEAYGQIFEDWRNEGIIEEVTDDVHSSQGHYLPHRPVFKESSATTKIRPVFDASARGKDSCSINDCLERGPNLMELIPSLIMRFRFQAFGVTSDIKGAFLQISVDPGDRDFLRFLWWRDGKRQEYKIYRHRRVVFGVTSSPFLLSAVLLHHLQSVSGELEGTARKLCTAFYVDNCVTSVRDPDRLHGFIQEARAIMASAGFDLRGWVHSPVEGRCYEDEPCNAATDRPGVVPVLGLLWNPQDDVLCCDVRGLLGRCEAPTTKRAILSLAQRVFDPIGFTAPLTLLPKLVLREICRMGYSWDQELPEEIVKRCRSWLDQLHWLQLCRLPRYVLEAQTSSSANISIHVFSDASQNAYAACVFLRAEGEAGNVSVQLLLAKSRIAPLKQATIPRLELLGALIGARLYSNVVNELKLEHCPAFHWSDSTVVVHWIQKEDQWGVFVGNRVREIRSLTKPCNWRHLASEHNAADLPSRGCTGRELHDSRWWEGPSWLYLHPKEWPRSTAVTPPEEIASERRKAAVSCLVESARELNFSRELLYFSRFTKLIRMAGWIRRFCFNARSCSSDRQYGELTAADIEQAERSIVGLIQRESFQGIQDKKIRTLQPFLDEGGLMRVRSKLEYVDDEESFKYPLLLPGDHPLVRRLVEDEHRKNCHAGAQTLRVLLRQKYWITRGRALARTVVQGCVLCRRQCTKPLEVPVAPLPLERLTSGLAFQSTGVDLAGPLWLKDRNKVWVVLFTCATYRAVHLELTTSLSSAAFKMALRRFVARRGRPETIFCDNGTNFRGTQRELAALRWNEVLEDSSLQRIKWRFSPPSAAWWGGWWERLVRVLKELIRRNLGRASLHYEELATLLCECENLMNNRPLTYLSEDPLDYAPLTPRHFLQPIVQNSTEDMDAVDAMTLRKRVRYVQKLREGLRQRFRREYLSELVHRVTRRPRAIKIGELVLIGSDSSKRIDWPLGRVVQLFPGRDGECRVARVKTAVGELDRPLQRLYPLELCSTEAEWLRPVESPGTPHEESILCTRRGRPVRRPRRLDL